MGKSNSSVCPACGGLRVECVGSDAICEPCNGTGEVVTSEDGLLWGIVDRAMADDTLTPEAKTAIISRALRGAR